MKSVLSSRIVAIATGSTIMVVGSVLLGSGAVSWADSHIGGDSIAQNTVDSSEIQNNSITSFDVSNGTLTGTDVRNGTLTGTDVKDGTLTGTDVGNGTLTGTDVQDGTLTGTDIRNGSLTRSHFRQDTVDWLTGHINSQQGVKGVGSASNSDASVPGSSSDDVLAIVQARYDSSVPVRLRMFQGGQDDVRGPELGSCVAVPFSGGQATCSFVAYVKGGALVTFASDDGNLEGVVVDGPLNTVTWVKVG